MNLKSTLPLHLLPSVAAVCLLSPHQAQAQGCVAIRSMGSPALPGLAGLNADERWLASAGYRYFQSDRYFMGSDDLSDIPGMAPGEQVINDVHTLDLAVSYTVTSRLNLTLSVPLVYAERTSREEHMGMMDFTQPQYTTRASGFGDLRLTGDFWVFDPEQHPHGNLALGLGVKAPTGSDDETDDFHTPAGIVNKPVDPSIQPGDGGWGMILQLQGFQQIVGNLSLYGNGLYLMNPREVNGVQSFSMKPLDANGEAYNSDQVNSVTDQYLGRLGLNYVIWPTAGLSLSLGGRIEGVPVNDLAGGDRGFRRPGYVISIEPGVNWARGRHRLAVTAPVALERNRQRSETEEAFANDPSPMLQLYPASFADWSLFAAYSFSF